MKTRIDPNEKRYTAAEMSTLLVGRVVESVDFEEAHDYLVIRFAGDITMYADTPSLYEHPKGA